MSKPTPYADLQAEIRRRKYPASYWIHWFAKATPLSIDLNNIDRCLKQHPCPEDRAALLWLRGEVLAILAKKRKEKSKPQQMVLDLGPSLAPFFAHAPHKPYCTDRLDSGLKVRPLAQAVAYRYLQANHPGQVWTLVQDVDRDVAEAARAEAWALGGPEANAVILNPANGHAHLVHYLAAGVTTTSAARLAPMRFLAVVEDGLCRAVGGDVGYAGLIAKNPLHKDWQVIERHGHLYTLDELAAGLDLTPANARNWTPANIEEAYGVGRNVGLFTETRFWAYSAIREYWAPNGLPRWQEAVLGHVEALNRRLRAPLPYPETKAIAKSIAKWTWRRLTPQEFRDLVDRTHTPEIQSKRGRKGGLAATNQLEIASLGGKASGEARRTAREDLQATARLMATAGHTQRQIAAALGLPKQTISRWLCNM